MDQEPRPLIPPHGGYRELRCFILAEIIYDGTVAFTSRHLQPRSRTVDQMVQAARSGSRNIAEGSRASGTSKKAELKLMGVARASLDELLLDYESYIRQNDLEVWEKDHPKAVFIRNLSNRNQLVRNETYALYRSYIEEKTPETAANTLICLIHQANFLLDRLIRSLEKRFVEQGGFTEKLYLARSVRRKQTDRADETNRPDQDPRPDPST